MCRPSSARKASDLRATKTWASLKNVTHLRGNDHVDGVAWAWRRADAIFPKFKLRNRPASDAESARLEVGVVRPELQILLREEPMRDAMQGLPGPVLIQSRNVSRSDGVERATTLSDAIDAKLKFNHHTESRTCSPSCSAVCQKSPSRPYNSWRTSSRSLSTV